MEANFCCEKELTKAGQGIRFTAWKTEYKRQRDEVQNKREDSVQKNREEMRGFGRKNQREKTESWCPNISLANNH